MGKETHKKIETDEFGDPILDNISEVNDVTLDDVAEELQINLHKKNPDPQPVNSNYKVVFDTGKAVKIQNGDKEAFIPKSWVEISENQATPMPAFEKRIEKKLQKAEPKKIIKPNSYALVKETEKALLLGFLVPSYKGEIPVQIWFPKKNIEFTGSELTIPTWIYQLKTSDIAEKYGQVEVTGTVMDKEKSIGLKVTIYEPLSEQEVKKVIWFPKSVVIIKSKYKIIVPTIFWEQKSQPILSEVRGTQFQGAYIDEDITFLPIELLDCVNTSFDPNKIGEKKEDQVTTADINITIESLMILLETAEGNEQKNIKDTIEALNQLI